jgi:hypothetical protein
MNTQEGRPTPQIVGWAMLGLGLTLATMSGLWVGRACGFPTEGGAAVRASEADEAATARPGRTLSR